MNTNTYRHIGLRCCAGGEHPTPTKNSKLRIRMKWTEDVNIFIMRAYYINTKLETDMTTYRKLLHEHFLKHYPHVLVSEQQISDPRLELQQEIISLHSQLSLSELQEINTTIPISQHLFLTNTQLSCN